MSDLQGDLFGGGAPMDDAAGLPTEAKPTGETPAAPVTAEEIIDLTEGDAAVDDATGSGGSGDGDGGGSGSDGDGPSDGPSDGDGQLQRMIDDNFLQYAAYVIRDRAIPDLDDGLKPVQRRILHSLNENDDGKFIKVANIVGHTMQYHPHGDASIADALVSLTNRGGLIEPQGNFGNVLTGDPPAASRYIECRLTEMARTQLFNDELTRFVPSYDGRRKEPICLPAKVPLLLMLGAEGIAVGLSTKILPHNLTELLEAQIAILKKKPFEIYPDFRQGGVMDVAEYEKGNGRVRVRADIEQRDDKTLVIRSVPFGTTTDSLIASIEAVAKKKSLNLKAINDYTAEAVEIEVVTKPGENLDRVKQKLYAFTQCQVTLSTRCVVIHHQRPVELDVEQVLRHNTKMLVRTLQRELNAEKRHLLDALHDKTLVQIFIENRIYKRIEECETYDAVQREVLDGVNEHRDLLRRDVTMKDVEMLLGVKIKRISLYDMNRHRKEIDDIVAGLEKVEKHLADLTGYAIRYVRGLLKKFAGNVSRRTRIASFDEIVVRKLTANELTLTYDAEKSYLGHTVAGDEELFQCSSLDKILVVRGDGGYKVMNPPDKVFVEAGLQYCAIMDRDKVFLAIYRDEHGYTFVKRFQFGGAILNRDYRCIPDDAELLFFSADDPEQLWVKYAKRKNQRIHQQVFKVGQLRVRGVKTRGNQMTSKSISKISTSKPRGWQDGNSGPPGVFLDR